MNNTDSCALGLKRGTKTPDYSVNFEMTFIRSIYAGQNLAQGALACAVLTHERVADSRHHVKTHILKRHRSGESFADAAKTNCGNGSFGTQEKELMQAQFRDWRGEAVFLVAPPEQTNRPAQKLFSQSQMI